MSNLPDTDAAQRAAENALLLNEHAQVVAAWSEDPNTAGGDATANDATIKVEENTPEDDGPIIPKKGNKK